MGVERFGKSVITSGLVGTQEPLRRHVRGVAQGERCRTYDISGIAGLRVRSANEREADWEIENLAVLRVLCQVGKLG